MWLKFSTVLNKGIIFPALWMTIPGHPDRGFNNSHPLILLRHLKGFLITCSAEPWSCSYLCSQHLNERLYSRGQLYMVHYVNSCILTGIHKGTFIFYGYIWLIFPYHWSSAFIEYALVSWIIIQGYIHITFIHGIVHSYYRWIALN